eukprot:TRINITY_DN12747_c0_g1_i3.p1 TRINITY_DN12747_c0_g1~~TRINITY_DN12747_c0_g1_i3.p1  ORF type:complete len:651 (+),score=125.36 TRINITY_DN12747_c0_g1_i3:48-1955(+)
MDEVISSWISRQLELLAAEAKEEDNRESAAAKKGWRGQLTESDRGYGGNTTLTLSGKAVGIAAKDVFNKGQTVRLQPQGFDDKVRGVVAGIKDTSVQVCIDSDDFQHEWMDTLVTVIPVSTDITYKAMKYALVGGGMGFGHADDDLPPLSRWSSRNSDQQTLTKLIFDSTFEYERVPPPEHITWFNKNLNPSQQTAVGQSLTGPTLILGPPGTGKTATVCELIMQLVARNKRVLAVTPSNVAADNIVERLVDSAYQNSERDTKLRVVRVGHSGRFSEEVAKYSLGARMAQTDAAKIIREVKTETQKLQRAIKRSKKSSEKRDMYHEIRSLNRDLRDQERKRSKEVLSRANVVVGTLVNSASYIVRSQMFDYVIIDEACQALESSCWIALPRAPVFVLAGDPFQLPPTVLTDSKELSKTLFERIYDNTTLRKDICCTLTTQYRMNELISEWSSKEFYDDRLLPDDSVAEHLLCDMDGVKETETSTIPFLLLDTSLAGYEEEEDVRGSKRNPGEVQVCSDHVNDLLSCGVVPSQIAVITPYAAQVASLRESLPESIEVGTVDGFQGREKEAIILSLVRSNEQGEIGFLKDYRRINVAITRARRQIVIVGDSSLMRQDKFLHRLSSYAEEAGVVLPVE